MNRATNGACPFVIPPVNLRLTSCLALLVLSITGCTPPQHKAQNTLRSVGAAALRQQAAMLYKNVFAAPVAGLMTIKRADWPPSFAAFAPLTVGAYRDGFALAIARDSERESGVYVIPASTDMQPRPTPRSRFERMEEGIYWYVFEL